LDIRKVNKNKTVLVTEMSFGLPKEKTLPIAIGRVFKDE